MRPATSRTPVKPFFVVLGRVVFLLLSQLLPPWPWSCSRLPAHDNMENCVWSSTYQTFKLALCYNSLPSCCHSLGRHYHELQLDYKPLTSSHQTLPSRWHLVPLHAHRTTIRSRPAATSYNGLPVDGAYSKPVMTRCHPFATPATPPLVTTRLPLATSSLPVIPTPLPLITTYLVATSYDRATTPYTAAHLPRSLCTRACVPLRHISSLPALALSVGSFIVATRFVCISCAVGWQGLLDLDQIWPQCHIVPCCCHRVCESSLDPREFQLGSLLFYLF